MKLFVTIFNRILKSSILNAGGVSSYSDSYRPPAATVLDRRLLASQLPSNKMTPLRASAKDTDTNPSFI